MEETAFPHIQNSEIRSPHLKSYEKKNFYNFDLRELVPPPRQGMFSRVLSWRPTPCNAPFKVKYVLQMRLLASFNTEDDPHPLFMTISTPPLQLSNSCLERWCRGKGGGGSRSVRKDCKETPRTYRRRKGTWCPTNPPPLNSPPSRSNFHSKKFLREHPPPLSL